MANLVLQVSVGGEFEEFTRDVENYISEVLDALPRAMAKVQERTHESTKKYLAVYPQPWRSAQDRFTWSNITENNDKARRYWFGVVLKGKKAKKGEKPSYRRTDELGKAWQTNASFSRTGDESGTVNFSILNTKEGSSYVYGYEPDGWARVPSHERTGWISANPQTQSFQRVIESAFQNTLEEIDNIAVEMDL